MLKIVEQSPTRLVLQDRRPRAALVAAAFTGISALIVVSLSAQGIQSFGNDAVDFRLLRVLGLAVFLAVCLGLVVVGGLATLNFRHGVTAVFDRERESFIVRRMNLFRPQEIAHPIYGVDRVDVETNDEIRAYGLFVVLRSGERIPLAAISMLDHDHMAQVVAAMRTFLRD